jgi:N-acetylneuraminic acid mutarotase
VSPFAVGQGTRDLRRLAPVLVAWGLLAAASASAEGTWTPTNVSQAPPAREGHTAVWTGSSMVVWGGYGGAPGDLAGGAVYDPAGDSWTATATTGAPAARDSHTAVWTGTKMIVWGGWAANVALDTGGVYDPATDTWTATSTAGAPSPRVWHTAVWTGSKMIVWGGMNLATHTYLDTGGIYDPATDTWTPVSTAGAPAARRFHSAVWTGSKMIVWGGIGADMYETGGIYDPATNTWTPTSTSGAPVRRISHTAVWTGSKMIVWGGLEYFSTAIGTGGVYDPATNTWAATSTSGAPVSRRDQTAVWTGSRMIVWGGTHESMSPAYDTGGIYDPAADTWRATPVTGAPAPRTYHTMVWTGARAIVWGGLDVNAFAYLYDGGLYDDAGLLPAATAFHTVTPCRLVDTRDPAGPTAGAALGAKTTRSFGVTGSTCGVPSTATSLSVNATAVGPLAAGYLAVYPGNWVSAPVASTLNFSAGQTRGNNAVVFLATDGTGTIRVKNGATGPVHFVLDVNGYFQ